MALFRVLGYIESPEEKHSVVGLKIPEIPGAYKYLEFIIRSKFGFPRIVTPSPVIVGGDKVIIKGVMDVDPDSAQHAREV